MNFYNSFNEMYNNQSTNKSDISVFNYEYEDEGDCQWDWRCYRFDGCADGTAELSVEYVTNVSDGDYWVPPYVKTNTKTVYLDFVTDWGYEYLKDYDYLITVDEAKEMDYVTGNTTNEPITKENWKEVAHTTFNWDVVWDGLEEIMDKDLWQEFFDKAGGDEPRKPSEVWEDEEAARFESYYEKYGSKGMDW